ncbi:MAG: sigma-70 family RNA polymerase sigma factor [Proteobacteria bacterium]|nr:sigma-70 family RNA polymerase sigma factor [Pseudomonadota bacterium]
MAQSDRQLLAEAKRGDKESMRMLYLAHKDHLYTLARALLQDQHMAEDVVHDVFVSFARALDGLQLRGSLRGYLSVSACNKARDIIRSRVRRQGYLRRVGEAQKTGDSPESLLATQESIEHLRAALHEVPLEQREVLLLRSQMGLTFKEIGKQQQVGIETAKGRYRYGLSRLKKLLAKLEAPTEKSQGKKKTI